MSRISDLLFAVACLLAAGGIVLRAVEPVGAQSFGPEVTGGEHAWVDVHQNIPFNNTITVYTVPSDRIFVLTAVMGQSASYLDIKQDGLLRVPGFSAAADGGPFSRGVGHAVFPAGSHVQVYNGLSTDRTIFLQGYLAHP